MPNYLSFQLEDNMILFTDLYELTMCASYFDNQQFEPATFDLFIRRLPPNRSYFLFTGLEQALIYLQNVKFTEQHLKYLRNLKFKEDFLDYLRKLRFTGDVWAIPEGTVVFHSEPLIRITAPIIEAQLVETFLLNTINLQTMIATKTSRVVQAASGKPVIEFGLRREQGIDAGMKVARSSFIAGAAGTSNVLAGMAYDIPVFGTMAHSYVMSFDREIDAFRAFVKTFPTKSTLLLDTYDSIAGAEKAATVAKEMEKKGFNLGGVRLDSGNLVQNSKKVRKILDSEGLQSVTIFASGDLDEFKISELLAKGAKIDAFGVGTKMGTSADYPYTDIIYKLCETGNERGEFQPIMKLSKNKITLPGRKQVYRIVDRQGCYARDVITLADEYSEGNPLLEKMISNGKLNYTLPDLKHIKENAAKNVAKLPEKYRKITAAETYPVELSNRLSNMITNLEEKIEKTEILDART